MSTTNRRPPVDVDTVADYTGTTSRWVRRAVAMKTIPHLHMGRLLRFDLDAIDEWMRENSIPTGGAR
jgi:excisionase family DNA binding protein